MPKITVLAGGVGASRFLQGLIAAYPPEDVTVISNTGDDVEIFGFHVSPDADIVTYALAGEVDPEKGWGLRGDTFNLLRAMGRFGHETWFNLGDKDLATCLHRSLRLRAGVPLHQVTAEITQAFGVACRIIPMCDERVETKVGTPEGELGFQEYMVRLRFEPEVTSLRFQGIESAKPASGVLEAIAEAEAVVVAPSNPLVSVGPILAVPGVREALASTPAKVAAVSPIVGGGVLKGPADRMMRSLGHDVSPAGVAAIYREFLDLMVIDQQDAAFVDAIRAMGLECIAIDTIMSDDRKKAELARQTVEAALRLT